MQTPPELLGPGQQPGSGTVTLLTTAWAAGELHECAAVLTGSHTYAVLSQISQRVAMEQSRRLAVARVPEVREVFAPDGAGLL